LLSTEPNLTRERIDEIIEAEMPLILENNGFVAGAGVGVRQPAASTPAPDMEKEQMAQKLKAMEVEMTNLKTKALKSRNKSLPPASGGRGGSGGDDPSVVPADVAKDRGKFKEWLRS
jgi:hypothetical protein